MTPPKWLTYAQLVRLPNVFTAFADVAMAGLAAGYILDRPDVFALLLAASGCLYLSGMAWNDLFDRREDAKTRPARPIPSGRVSPRAAGGLAAALMIAGVLLAAAAGSPFVGLGLAALILLYDSFFKHTPLGPVAMGGCRSLNVVLGLSAGQGDLFAPLNLHLAGTVGFYIVGVTWFARTEEGTSRRWQLTAAAAVMAAALGLAVTVPAHLPEADAFRPYPYLVVAFGFYLSTAVVVAVQSPTPGPVQAAVKRCILGLVPLDAVLATAFVGLPGLLLIALWLPARVLGRRVYST